MEGCRPSQKVMLERLQPALKAVDMPTELPIDRSSANALGASIMQGVASGQLSTSQAKALVGVLKDISPLSAVEQMQSELLELKWSRSAC